MKKLTFRTLFLGLTAFIFILIMLFKNKSVRKSQLEAEISSFMLDHIIQQEIKWNAVHVTKTPPLTNIIIWEQPETITPGEDASHVLNLSNPIKVWYYSEDCVLSEEKNKFEAIDWYQNNYMLTGDHLFWGFYQYAILSIDENEQKAKVYLDASLGGEQKTNNHLYTIQRNVYGKWRILGPKDYELVG
jgi:hypothetical protein